MKATSKKQITIAALEAHDEIVTYSNSNSGHSACIKMRTIEGKRAFTIDTAVPARSRFTSDRYHTLTEAKSKISFCNHF